MSLRKNGFVVLVVGLAGCTHANISSIPMEISGVGTAYRYQGRANFAHQFAEADRMITEDCKRRNGGRPVIVSAQKQDLGVVAFRNGNSTTNATVQATGNRYGATAYGTAHTYSSGATTYMRNKNQEILYKCVK